MRYEAMRLLQFVFSLSLILAAFLSGVLVGWRRWGRARPVTHSAEHEAGTPEDVVDLRSAPGRPDLFATAPDHRENGGRVGAIPARVRRSRAALPVSTGDDP